MTAQQQIAMQEMVDWLAHEQELGQPPSEIELAGEFDLHEMRYYIFKYKENALGEWLLGVCGGYEDEEDTEHCGHVFSEMEAYDPNTAEQEAIKMVEMIREYWMQRAASEEDDEESEPGLFNGFVLLNSAQCDFEQIKANLLNDWGISAVSEDDKADEEMLFLEVDNCAVAASFINAPIPDGEAEHFAEGNYLWPEAVEVTKTHVAQILLAVLPRGCSAIDSSKIYTKLAASCLKLPNAIGIYTGGTVAQPEIFIDMAEMLRDEEIIPLLNVVYFGLIGTENGTDGYTYGLKAFGKDEIEVLGSSLTPSDMRDFLITISGYIVGEDVTLQDGETIGFTAEQKLPITRSEGLYLEGQTLKIHYM